MNLALRSLPKASLAVPIVGRDHIQGPVDAPLVLVEYGDFECPYCGEAYPIIKAIQERLGDSLCFVFRHFPLASMHRHAQHAAEAAEAADAQGQFWQMHDRLFENQQALQDDALVRYAKELGLDARRLFREVLAGRYSARVREDFRAGARSGVNGTPKFFINGVRYDGTPETHAMLATLLESAVA